MTQRIAIAQITMRWTTPENLKAIRWAMDVASAQGAQLCAFAELAVTGFHRQIAQEAKPEVVGPALRELQDHAARRGIGIAVGAPSFGADGSKYISHYLISPSGEHAALVCKRGLTAPEATFFARGSSRPVGLLGGLRCSAVICREIEDLDAVSADLPAGGTDLIFVPGALRNDPAKPRTDPPGYVQDIQRLARATGASVVQTNWPNALNRPEESVDGGGSAVFAPDGEVLFRLPMQAAGVGVFTLGQRQFEWHAEA